MIYAARANNNLIIYSPANTAIYYKKCDLVKSIPQLCSIISYRPLHLKRFTPTSHEWVLSRRERFLLRKGKLIALPAPRAVVAGGIHFGFSEQGVLNMAL